MAIIADSHHNILNISEKLLRKWAEIETGVVALSFPCVL